MPRWFCRKTFGYGWTPVTWQGWLVLALFVAIVFAINRGVFGMDHAARVEVTLALVVAAVAVSAFTSGRDSDA
jgi:hypothetical protein